MVVEGIQYTLLGSRTLKKGLQGSDVELVQYFLKTLPEPIGTPGLKVDGVFGPATEMAVMKFQRYFKLEVDGIVGKNTFLFLGVPTGPYLPYGAQLFGSRVLKLGSSGYDVGVLQNRLASTAKKYALALGVPATKYFDERTERAVKLFQKDVCLAPDGIVGPATVYQLYRYTTMGSRLLQRGRWDRNQGYDVYWLQRHLKEMGYYQDSLDGIFGPLTRNAVIELQKKSNIAVDGIVGPQTYFHLAVS